MLVSNAIQNRVIYITLTTVVRRASITRMTNYVGSMSRKKSFSTYPRTSRANGIALSDVDGTIVKGSLVLNHACWLHREQVINLGDLPGKWLRNQKNERIIQDLAEEYREAIIGKTEQDIMVDEYVDSVVSNPSRFYSTLYRLRLMRKRGTRVVLISGSPSFLVSRLGDRFQFDTVATTYLKDTRGRFTGEYEGMFTSAAKKAYLKRLNLERYSSVIAFGDTRSDVPLLERAHWRILVDPNADTHQAVGHMVNEIVHD